MYEHICMHTYEGRKGVDFYGDPRRKQSGMSTSSHSSCLDALDAAVIRELE